MRYRREIAASLVAWDGKAAGWGVDDCASALWDIDLAVTGINTGAAYRGRYDSKESAERLMGRMGLIGEWGKVARRFGWKRIHRHEIALARDGDRAVAMGPAGVTSVIRYRGKWVGRYDRGNIMTTDAQVLRAWRVC